MRFDDIKLPSNKKFGFFFFIVFLLASVYFFYKHLLGASYSLLSLAIVFLIVTLIDADKLISLNRLWMRLGLTLGIIISPIIMGLIFFGIFMPVSMLMKLFRRDELRLKTSSRTSHWKIRDDVVVKSIAFERQF